MFNYLLAIAADAVKDHSHNWLLTAAAVLPLLALLAKKRKQRWLQRLMIKKVNSKRSGLFQRLLLKKLTKRKGKEKGMSDGVAILIVVLAFLGLGALIVWWLGWTWAIVILVVGLLIIGRKKPDEDYE
jgi:hypothetical protein